jgi:hypothetical protein
MNRGAASALIARNALACEEARTEKCVCSCGGKFHGAAHSKSWQLEQVDLIADDEDGEDPDQGTFGFGEALAHRFRA